MAAIDYIRIVIVCVSLVILIFSLVEFILWAVRYERGEKSIHPFAAVGAVVVGIVIVGAVLYGVIVFLITDGPDKVRLIFRTAFGGEP